MFWLIWVLLVTINNQSRSWSAIHRCSDWSGSYLSLSIINGDPDHPYTDVQSDQGLTCHYQQPVKTLIIHTRMFWLIRGLLVTINNQSRSWWATHRCYDWSGPYLSLSTINQDLDHPYTGVLTDQGLTCYCQQSIKILIIHTQMFWLIRALLVTINNQSRSWSSIHRWTDCSGPYLSLSTINQDLDHPYTDVMTDQGLTCHCQLSLNGDLDHPYTDVLTDQGLTCHCQQSIKILIILTQMLWLIRALLVTINNQSRSWSAIRRCFDWSGPFCHYQRSIKILIIHKQMFCLIRALLVNINNQWRSWSSIHRCSDWSGPYLSLSTINRDLDHPYTDVLTDQGLTCHYQQSIEILIIHTQMFWLIRALHVTINNQLRSWSSIHRCSDWSEPYLSLSTNNGDLDHPYTDVLTDQGLTCHY